MNGTASGLLEPCAGKLASTVLRGRGSGDAALLPDQELGGRVRKGESGSLVVFASTLHRTETDQTSGEDVELDGRRRRRSGGTKTSYEWLKAL